MAEASASDAVSNGYAGHDEAETSAPELVYGCSRKTGGEE
jgi:hypothetical protein